MNLHVSCELKNIKMKRIKKYLLITALFTLPIISAFSQEVTLVSPSEKILVRLNNRQNTDVGEWYLMVTYVDNGKSSVVIPQINLGLVRSDQDFSNNLKISKIGKTLLIKESYTVLHGKRSHCSNSANELTIFFENTNKAKLNLIIRAYNVWLFTTNFPIKTVPLSLRTN